jgi:hypothetical protein
MQQSTNSRASLQREKQMLMPRVRSYILSSLSFHDISKAYLLHRTRCGAERNIDIMVALHPHHAAYHSAFFELHPTDETDTGGSRNSNEYICWYGNIPGKT